MNASDQIIQVLDYLANKLGIAVDWSSQNLSPFIQEVCTKYIQYEIYTSVGWIVLAVVVAIIGSMFALHYNEYGVIAFLMITAVIIIGFQGFDIIRCNTVPELQIFHYLTDNIIPKLK